MNPLFEYGWLVIHNRGTGSTAVLNCSDMFTLIGESTYTCDKNGIWIGNGSCGKFSSTNS